MNTREKILNNATEIFALSGYEGLSMRTLAKQAGITQSVLYHYFDSKDSLLEELFKFLNHNLGIKRKALRKLNSASLMLKQRIEFQLDNAKEVVAVLKYFIHNRTSFSKTVDGFIPDKASHHMEEVLELGKKNAEFRIYNLKQQAKVMTHAVNGYLLEYFPYQLKDQEKNQLVKSIHRFLICSLKK